MDDVKELCKRIIIIDKGKLLFDGELSEIIHKFADHKLLTIVFSSGIDKKDLEKYGLIKEFEPPKAVISVKRADAPKVAGKILENFEIEDLNIEEPQIEDIIREVFTGKDVA